MKLKKLFKPLTFLLVFGFIATYLIGITIGVGAADSKYIDIISGTGRNFGDEVAIGDEHFYIITNNGSEIKMLAKYNVDISAKCTYNYQAGDSEKVGYSPECGVRTDATKLQDASISGLPNTATGEVIGVPFATTAMHGATNVTYKGSVIEQYVNEYVDTVNKKYNVNVKGELLDLQTFNKVFKNVNLASAPDSIKKFANVSYWTMTPTQAENTLMIIDATDQKYYSFLYDKFFGVRPVIVAPASAVNYKEIERSCEGSMCFADKDEDGKVSTSDEICIRDECFYVVSNDNNQVKLLAKYNLNTGLNCAAVSTTETSKSSIHNLSCSVISGVQLRQNVNARGFINPSGGQVVSYGGITYSESDITTTLNEYVSYLKTLVDADFNASLLTLDDVTAISGDNLEDYINPAVEAQVYYLYYTKNVPDWIYSNSFWTTSASGTGNKFAIMSDGTVASFPNDTSGEFGLRPLITVPLENIPTAKKDIDNSSCYVCGDEYVWTDSPDESSCELKSEITDENSCVSNPNMGIEKHTLLIMIVISIAIITLAILSKNNRFKRI